MFTQYQEKIIESTPSVARATKDNMLIYGTMGLSEKAGNIAGLLEQQIFFGQSLDRERCVRECRGALECLAMIAESLGITLEELANENE